MTRFFILDQEMHDIAWMTFVDVRCKARKGKSWAKFSIPNWLDKFICKIYRLWLRMKFRVVAAMVVQAKMFWRWYKICARGLCVNLLNLKINVKSSAEICLPQRLSVRTQHAFHFVQNLEIAKNVARNFDRYGICMKYQKTWYEICVRGLCVKLLKLKINARLLDEICLPQRLSVRKKNLEIPKTEVAGVTFLDSDSAPVPKFWNLGPDPGPAIFKF